MSDIAQNALRYTTNNTGRSDKPSSHNGQQIGKQENGEDVIGFDCSGFVCHVIIESGYRINYEDGHVGIVTEYEHNSAFNKFVHMSGNSKKGGVLKRSYFISKEINEKPPRGPDGNIIIYGTIRAIKAFRRVNSSRYSAVIDLHRNGSNPAPTLRPLGTTVYSDHVRKTPKTRKPAKKKNLPMIKSIHTKSVPQQAGYVILLNKLFGNFRNL